MGRHTETRLKLPQKSKLTETEYKVESKLAKTNPNGQIECIICKVTVKSAALWKVHVNSKLHKERIAIVKQIKQSTCQGGNTADKTTPKSTTKTTTTNKIEDNKRNEKSAAASKPTKVQPPKVATTPTTAAPATATAIVAPQLKQQQSATLAGTDNTSPNDISTLLPEKFFDDPVKDAKIRNIEYKDPQDDEWERFQREIREASSVSVAIVAGEQIESAFDRDLDEINDQMKHWSRYMNLEARKGVLGGVVKGQQGETHSSDENDESGDETTTTEFSDWRSKSFI